MFWDCPKIQDYWFDVQGWLHTNFIHCTDIIVSEEPVILGSKANVVHFLSWLHTGSVLCIQNTSLYAKAKEMSLKKQKEKNIHELCVSVTFGRGSAMKLV